jgi:LysM repeat protein
MYRSYFYGQLETLDNLGGSTFFVQDDTVANRSIAVFDWIPQKNQEAASYQICFRLQDLCEYAVKQSWCVNISVLKCQICVSQGQTMQSIAADYGSDFLSLYTANVAIQRPQRLPVGTTLNIGIFYRIQQGDTLSRISERYFASIEKTLLVNPDIARGKPMTPGDQICLSIPVCGLHCHNWESCRSDGAPFAGGLLTSQ